MESRCRLTIEPGEAMLDGEPTELRRLALALQEAPDEITVGLAVGTVVRRRTSSPLLRVSVSEGTLTVEGDNRALELFYESLDGVADAADAAGATGVPQHQHIEYLGEDDRWRSPDTLPLVVGADCPTG